jgi:eukaryotic-like serine/threonine-protein kinase
MALIPGQQLQKGKYTIEKELGRGRVGITYLANRSDGERRAIKILNPDVLASLNVIERERLESKFWEEAVKLAKCSGTHHIVRIDTPFIEGTVAYLPMEYLDGNSLADRGQRILSEEKALDYIRQIGEALAVVHQQGLVHCDIHPGNIILRQSREPVLIDFGSAKLLKPHTMTVTTTINESFAPYEQRAGSNPQPTLDVYGLAATLYFAITGQKPQAAIDRKMYGDTLIPPKQHRSELSDWLNRAIIKGMALESKDRPSSMQAWVDLLQAPRTVTEKIKPQKLPSSPTEKSSFPWRFVGSILLGHLPMGILVGFHSNSFAHMTLAMVMLVAWSQAIIMSMAMAGEKPTVDWIAIIAAGAGTWAWAGVGWAWAWAGLWAGFVVISTSKKIRADISGGFLMVGALLGGGISGYFTSTGLWYGLAQ